MKSLSRNNKENKLKLFQCEVRLRVVHHPTVQEGAYIIEAKSNSVVVDDGCCVSRWPE